MKLALHWQILIAICLGGVAGWLGGEAGQIAGMQLLPIYEFVGTLFLNALKMLIVPLIASSIIVGVAGIGSSGNLGRLGSKTLLFYLLTTLAAILVGLALVNLVKPGEMGGQPVQSLLALDGNGTDIAMAVGDRGVGDVVDIFLRAVPPNIVAAAAEGQMLGFEPDDLPGSTIGGVAATNTAGARRVLAGAARDALIGVRFVDGQGQVIRNGGRVMKNVTGYDLVKLMAGSRGQLGVLTELSFRTTPLPQVTNTLQLRDLDAADAIRAFTVALGGPYDVSAARWTPDHGALIRLEGLRASVASRSAELARRLSDFGSLSQIEDHPWHRPATAAADPAQDVWRIICRPSQAPTLLERLPQPMLLDWGGALIHVAMPRGQTPDLSHFAGHARRIAGQGAAILPPPDPVTDRIQRDLRDRFDPRGIFRGAR